MNADEKLLFFCQLLFSVFKKEFFICSIFQKNEQIMNPQKYSESSVFS